MAALALSSLGIEVKRTLMMDNLAIYGLKILKNVNDLKASAIEIETAHREFHEIEHNESAVTGN